MTRPVADASRGLRGLPRAIADAGLRYVATMSELAIDLAGAVAVASADRGRQIREMVAAGLPLPAGRSEAALPVATDHATHRATVGQPTTILIEAEAGRDGVGVFLVENRGPAPVSAEATVSTFADGAGREVGLEVRFEPPVVALAPGEQSVVQVVASVEESLEPGVRYLATVTLPGLSEIGIPLAVRRRPHSVSASPEVAEPAATEPEPGLPRRRAAQKPTEPATIRRRRRKAARNDT